MLPIIRNGIVDFNAQIIKEKTSHFSVFPKDGDQIIGTALIWKQSDLIYSGAMNNTENKASGQKLSPLMDDVAKNKRSPKIFFHTYEFQAQAFYEKHSFYCIGTIPKYLKDYDPIFMRKDIS